MKNFNIKQKKSSIKNLKRGKNCVIRLPVNIYDCEIGNSVFIGPFVEIQRNVIIGSKTRISSHTFICELVTIGNNCFIGHGVNFTNDLFLNGKLAGDKKKWKKTKIGNNVLIGSNTTVLPVIIADGVTIGAGSVVTKDIKIKGIYSGNPAKLLRRLK
jgi:acetyltransferase-like isoleucine patch superfamily enzyme